MKQLWKLALVTFVFAGCSGKQVVSGDNSSVTQNDLVNVDVHWVKLKGKKYDIEMMIKNISKNDIIISLNDMNCYKGPSPGQLHHTFFNTGERTIDFRKDQAKQFRMVCDLGVKVDGEPRVVINRIYDNPSADGATKGKVLGGPIEWSSHGKKTM